MKDIKIRYEKLFIQLDYKEENSRVKEIYFDKKVIETLIYILKQNVKEFELISYDESYPFVWIYDYLVSKRIDFKVIATKDSLIENRITFKIYLLSEVNI
jgi:hypothetical protein